MENAGAVPGCPAQQEDVVMAGSTVTDGGQGQSEVSAPQTACAESVPQDSGGGTKAGSPSPVGRRKRAVAPTIPIPADDIPFGAVGGNVRAILQRTAPYTANVVFDQINRLKRLAYEAHLMGDAEACVLAARATGQLALKTLELTVGKQVNVSGTIRSQADIPNWDRIPLVVRQRYLETLETAMSLDGGDTIIEGEVVPLTDEAAYSQPATEEVDDVEDNPA